MSAKWTNAEIDGFSGEICDAVIEGFDLRVLRGGIPKWDKLPGGEVAVRIRRILIYHVDFKSDEWARFDTDTGLMRTLSIREVLDIFLGRIQDRINARVRYLSARDWGPGGDPRFAAPVTVDEMRTRHAETLRNAIAVRENFEKILCSFEVEYQAIENARLAARRAEELAREEATLAEDEADSLAERESVAREHREHRERVQNRPAPEPEAQRYGVSHRGAEFLVADWMRHLGLRSSVVTPASSDGGVDVESDSYIAQVKNYTGNVSVIEIRELYGVAAAQGKKALFFTSGGYTVEARTLASRIEMPLLRYVAEKGVLQGVDVLGQRIVVDGLSEPDES